MHALLLTQYGHPPNLTVGEIADPTPGDGQVVIRVDAAGLNPVDAKLAQGFMASVMHFELPIAMGWDFVGAVETAGSGVGDEYAVGRAVFGCLGPPTGSTAERLVADASGPWIAPLPHGLSLAHAATAPMVGLTAMTAQRALERTGTVLVIGASGGVGAFLVPLLIDAGQRVIATGAGEAVARLEAAGAAEIVDYRAGGLAEQVRALGADGVDAVIDLVNQFDDLNASAALLRPGGQLLSTLFGPDAEAMERQDIELTYVRNDAQPGDLGRIGQLLISGTVTPPPPRVVTLEGAQAAFGELLTGRGGKIAIDVRGVLAV